MDCSKAIQTPNTGVVGPSYVVHGRISIDKRRYGGGVIQARNFYEPDHALLVTAPHCRSAGALNSADSDSTSGETPIFLRGTNKPEEARIRSGFEAYSTVIC